MLPLCCFVPILIVFVSETDSSNSFPHNAMPSVGSLTLAERPGGGEVPQIKVKLTAEGQKTLNIYAKLLNVNQVLDAQVNLIYMLSHVCASALQNLRRVAFFFKPGHVWFPTYIWVWKKQVTPSAISTYVKVVSIYLLTKSFSLGRCPDNAMHAVSSA